MKKSLIVCGHGSKNEGGIRSFLRVYEALAGSFPENSLDYAFLEYSEPSLNEVILKHITQGADEILIVPAILFTGVHIRYDIPYIIKTFQQQYPLVIIKLAGYMGHSAPVIDNCQANIDKAESGYSYLGRNNSCLFVVGVGSSISGANADIASVTRILWEAGGFYFGGYAFISRMTKPPVRQVFDLLNHLPCRRMVVFPLLLFPGVYLEHIHLELEACKQHTDKEIVIAEPLDNAQLLASAMQLRIEETERGIDYARNIPVGILPRKGHRFEA